MMQRTGLTIDLVDNTSSSASKISDELNKISSGAEGIGKALDPGVLDDYMSKLDQVGQKYAALNNQMGRGGTGGGRGNNGIATGVTGTFQNVSGMTSAASRGDIGGMASQGASGAGNILSAAGGGGGAAMAIAALGATIAGGNALSQAYEGRMPGSMTATAMMGRYSYDIDENTKKISEAMNDVSVSVRRYGKTYEEGSQAIEGYLRAGGSAGSAMNAIGEAAKYSQGYGANMAMAANFQGLSSRYGGGSQVLDVVNGLMRQQGLNPGQYDELLEGMQQIFTTSLSSGITKDIAQIATSAAYFGQAGETYKGAMGAGFMQQLDQAAQSATGLNKQEDIFLFRAASKMTGGNYLETMKMLEGGFTGQGGVELFKGFMGELGTFTGGTKENMVKQMVNTLGISYTQAEDLYSLYQGGGKEVTTDEIRKSMGQGYGESLQRTYLGNVEELKGGLATTFGEPAFRVKAGILEGTLGAAEWAGGKIQEISEASVSKMEVRNFVIDNNQMNQRMQQLVNAAEYETPDNQQAIYEFQAAYQKALKAIKDDPTMSTDLMSPFAQKFEESYASEGISRDEMAEMLVLLRQITDNTGNTSAGVNSDSEMVIDQRNFEAAGAQYQKYMGGR